MISENCDLKKRFHDLEVRFIERIDTNDRLLKEQECRHENVMREHELVIKSLQKENHVLELRINLKGKLMMYLNYKKKLKDATRK